LTWYGLQSAIELNESITILEHSAKFLRDFKQFHVRNHYVFHSGLPLLHQRREAAAQ
jgi:hypothetical protein